MSLPSLAWDDFTSQATDIQNQVAKELEDRAKTLGGVDVKTSMSISRKLASEGYEELKKRVQDSFQGSPGSSNMIELFLISTSTYFHSPYELRGKLEKILVK